MKYSKVLFIAWFFLAGLLCTSCKQIIGYSVVLWSIPEYEIYDGDIVTVYIRSNIGNVYVISNKNNKQKIEIPLWQITEPQSLKQARLYAEEYNAYNRQYARVKRDGLPVRLEPRNVARQVYRLKKDEVIKVLKKGEGEVVMAGKTPLQGEWLNILTRDGTIGWTYSYNLTLFDERDGIVVVEKQEEKDELLEEVLNKTWYPEYYNTIITANHIDLTRIKAEYKFDTGFTSGTTRFTFLKTNISYPYTGVSKIEQNTYAFNNTNLKIIIKRSDYIVLQYTDSKGFPISMNLISLEPKEGEDSNSIIDSIIAKEKQRRIDTYTSILSFGNIFASDNYGTIDLRPDSTFTWQGFNILVKAGIIPKISSQSTANTQGYGKVYIKYFSTKNILQDFDGVISFAFNDRKDEVNFFYTVNATGLKMENIDNANIKNELVSARSRNPLVLFFSSEGTE